MLCLECRRAVLWVRYCSSCTHRSISSFWRIRSLVIPLTSLGVAVAESLKRELWKVSEWCDLKERKLNASNAKTMVVSMSRTIYFQSPILTAGGTVQKESDDRCRISQHRRIFISFSVSLLNTILLALHSMVVNWRVLRAESMLLYRTKLLSPISFSAVFHCLLSLFLGMLHLNNV